MDFTVFIVVPSLTPDHVKIIFQSVKNVGLVMVVYDKGRTEDKVVQVSLIVVIITYEVLKSLR